MTPSDELGPARGPQAADYRRLRAAVFREPLLTTSTARRKPRRARPKRPESRVARWVRRRPLAATYCLLSTFFFGLYWSEKVQIRVEEPIQYDMHLAARAAMDVKDLLGVIGHGVTVSSVEALRNDREFAAAYHIEDRRVLVESENEFRDDALLYVMGHECAHALFIQSDLLEYDARIGAYQYFVHQVAADVLGAHFAGRVRSLRGGDGRALTKNLLEETRIMSRSYAIDPFTIKDRIQTNWDGTVRTYMGDGYWLHPNPGSEQLINRIDRICREHPDPWEAARTVADELHNVDAQTAYKVVPARVWLARR